MAATTSTSATTTCHGGDDTCHITAIACETCDVDYSYEERILIAPLASSAASGDVRLESYAVLTPPNLRPAANDTPFPESIVEIMQSLQATRVQIQVNNRSQQRYSMSPLDEVPLLSSDEKLFEQSTRRLLTAAPSGIFVSAQFQSSYPTAAKQRFQSLLEQLVARRILVAPLVTAAQDRFMASGTNRTPQRHLLVEPTGEAVDSSLRVSTSLPWEGSPFSSEGLKAFLDLSPCQATKSGVWGVATASIWSSQLLDKKTPHGHHGFYLDLEATPPCFRADSGGKGLATCRYSLAQGLRYSSEFDGGRGGTSSLSDWLPLEQRQKRYEFETCPFADTTRLEVVSGKDVSYPSWLLGCARDAQAHEGGRTFASGNLQRSSVLLTGKVPVSDPCFAVSYDMASENVDTRRLGGPRTLIQEIHLDVLRRSGLANQGTLIATIRNVDMECPVFASFHLSLPLVVEPVWQSLSVSSDDGLISRTINWTSLSGHSIKFPSPSNDDWTVLAFQGHEIPPASALQITLDYDPVFLSFESFSADPNRGFEIPPFRAILRNSPTCQRPHIPTEQALASNAVLLLAPVPDMSMPFNVLSLTCSLYVFVIGSLLNLAVRKASESVKRKVHPPKPTKAQLLKHRVQHFITDFKSRLTRGVVKSDS